MIERIRNYDRWNKMTHFFVLPEPIIVNLLRMDEEINKNNKKSL